MYYIDAVNSVLKRLREDEVATVDQNEQSKVIGELLNDALKEVEEAWDWQALLVSDTMPIVASVRNYSIVDSQNRITINDIYNTTSDAPLKSWSKAMMRKKIIQDTSTSSPYAYAQGLTDTNGDNTIDIYPIPNDAYTLSVSYYQRSGRLTAEGDEITIPSQPVLLLAYAKAQRERGDDPTSVAMCYEEARRSLSDAIAYDHSNDTSDTQWVVV